VKGNTAKRVSKALREQLFMVFSFFSAAGEKKKKSPDQSKIDPGMPILSTNCHGRSLVHEDSLHAGWKAGIFGATEKTTLYAGS
jgi:hypothetical protein